MAHPCLADAEAALGSSLTLHTGGTWAGNLPSLEDLSHECADDLNSYQFQSIADTSVAADPVPGVPAGPVVSAAGFQVSNLTALGYSAREVPYTGTGSSVYNSDLAFKDNYVFQGTYEGFRIIDATDKTRPTQILNYTGCNVGQGDVMVYGNLLIRSWDSPASSSSTCAGQLVGSGFEGIHIFDITDPTAPVMVRQLRMASSGNEPGAPAGCGSHTATLVPDAARGDLYIYNGASSGSCRGIDIVRVDIADPTDAVFLRRISHEVPTRTGNNSCHDNNVLMGVGGTTTGYAMCAGGNGLAMYKFDTALDPEAEGGVAKPTLLWSQSMSVSTGHSGSFTYDGKYLIYGHEPGGGSAARCQATSTISERTLFFIDPLTGETKGTMLHPRPQTSRENCTWHNFNVVPTKAGYYATVGSYQSGISVFDFSNPAMPREIAYADPKPLTTEPPTAGIVLGGDWSTYWHNGYIYESDIKRGLITWRLNLPNGEAQAREHLNRTNTFALSNPQTQMVSYESDAAPTITVASPVEGAQFKQGDMTVADFECADNDALVSCVGTVADGETMEMTTLGNKVFRVTAMDSAGTMVTKDVAYMVNSTDVTMPAATGSVDTALALVLPTTSPSFGAFTPGVAREYLTSAAPRITSTAGDVSLSVSDPATTNVGRLVNGTATLTNALQVYAASTNAAAVASPGGNVGGSAAPTGLINYSAPVTNGTVTLTFRQNITATETLRSGTYGKALTFTLSTTSP